MDGMLWTVAGVGFLLGVRHALDPDHVVAVSTIVAEHRSLGRSSLVGAFWGLGHTVSLLAASGAVLALKLNIPESVANVLEAGVALMLILLGGSAIRRGLSDWKVHAHRHDHGGREHVHFHAHRAGAPQGNHKHKHEHEHVHVLGFGFRPFSVGVVHGLAGSAGLALVAVGTSPSAGAGLLYMGMLGLGSLGGMFLLSGIMSLPLALLAKRYKTFSGGVQLVAGLGSLGFGFWLFGSHVAAGGWLS